MKIVLAVILAFNMIFCQNNKEHPDDLLLKPRKFQDNVLIGSMQNSSANNIFKLAKQDSLKHIKKMPVKNLSKTIKEQSFVNRIEEFKQDQRKPLKSTSQNKTINSGRVKLTNQDFDEDLSKNKNLKRLLYLIKARTGISEI